MMISSIQPNSKINFTSNCREVTNAAGQVINRNSTMFFRTDFNWDKFITYLAEKYKNQHKVNVYCYACSDGSEPYSLAMGLISKLGEGAKKFFPIIAKDKDGFFLNQARMGLLDLEEMDVFEIMNRTNRLASDFLDGIPKNFSENDKFTCKIKDILKNTVTFEQADVLTDIGKIERDNAVVMFRNAWPYLSKQDRETLAKKLNQRLGENSILAIGDFDTRVSGCRSDIIKSGFIPIDIEHCYEKTGSAGDALTDPHLTDPQFLLNTFGRTKPTK